MKNILSLFLLTALLLSGYAKTVTVLPQQAEIICPKDANAIVQLATSELQKHLQLITGTNITVSNTPTPQRYQFYLAPPQGKNVTLPRENAVIDVTPHATYLYGDDYLGTKAWENNPKRVFYKTYRTGTLFAVYDFLEKNLGVRWIQPGDQGIVVEPAKTLKLSLGSHTWKPAFIQREIRAGGYYGYKNYLKSTKVANIGFQLTHNDYDRSIQDVNLWLKRQKMGNSYYFGYGHAFTQWWNKYGKTNPEFFAMQGDGIRRPEYARDPDRCKMCVSNPKLHEKILELAGNSRFINVCENDSGGYCQCPQCRALDATLPGERFDDHLTDRYVWFANQIQQKAAARNPETRVVFYAYACYRFPPRKTKIDPRIIVGFVPSMLNLDAVQDMYQKWRDMGLKNVFLRPNDQHIACGLPMGYERQLFDHFQLGVKYGIIGTDYDSLHNFWPTGGMADYILARAHSEPNQTFEHWEDDYCKAYGPAAESVKHYYRYWREQVWENRLMKDKKTIIERGRYGNFRRGLMWGLKNYYHLSDFDKTDRILAQGMKQNLTDPQKARLATLQLANRHARLTVEAVLATGQAKFIAGRKLLEFRLKHQKDLNFNWAKLITLEDEFGDITGIQLAAKFKDCLEARALPFQWTFQPDTKNLGQKEQWEKQSADKLACIWEPILVDRAWEKQTLAAMSPEMKTLLKNYDGIGYYALKLRIPKEWKGQKVSLYFGAVDESAWIYVNGQLAGTHLYKEPEDWQTPFFIPIDRQIDWSKPYQSLVVRVEDKAGAGGIWRPVFMVIK